MVALDNVSLEVSDRELLVLLGPSGCGKSTLLRIVAGLESADEGNISLHGKDIGRIPPQARRSAMVFQYDALYPHMSVYENLVFPLRMHKRSEVAALVGAIAQRFNIVELLRARPAQLSGGQRQRVALVRAMLRDPQVVLFDEPLAHIDGQVRAILQEEILSFAASFGGPAIYVTHDHPEAMALADRIAILQAGKLMQCDTPQRVFDRPANTFVAGFFGIPGMNLLPGMRADRTILGIRAEHITMTRDAADLSGTVRSIRRIAADSFTGVETTYGMLLVRSVPGCELFALGERIFLRFEPGFVRLFDRQSGNALAP